MKKILLFVAATILAVSQSANAATIGANELLGVIVPGTPANEPNEQIMVNGLLEGWELLGPDVLGYKDGALTGSVLGNNPNDPNNETYTLKFSAASTVLPAPGSAPLATSNSGHVLTSNPTFNLGASTYDWVLAKWGPNAAVYYIGNLGAGTQVTLSLGGTGFTGGTGLSHYVLFNKKTTNVPDGGSTAALLGSVLLAFGVLRQRFGRN